MPLYDFKCENCGLVVELSIYVKDKDTQKCKECGGKLVSQITTSTNPSSLIYPYSCKYSGCHFTGPRDREMKLREKGYAIMG